MCLATFPGVRPDAMPPHSFRLKKSSGFCLPASIQTRPSFLGCHNWRQISGVLEGRWRFTESLDAATDRLTRTLNGGIERTSRGLPRCRNLPDARVSAVEVDMESRELGLRRIHHVVRFSLIILVVLGLTTLPAFPQTGVGTVSGTVRDSAEAFVSGAKVTITNAETGISKQVVTIQEGLYSFPALPIGPYRLAVEKEGFQTWVGTLTLYVGQNVTVDATLRVGSVKDVVEVKDVATPIETASGVIGDVRESSQIRDLPLNGRDVGLLFGLTAGVESGSGGGPGNGVDGASLAIHPERGTQPVRFGGGD